MTKTRQQIWINIYQELIINESIIDSVESKLVSDIKHCIENMGEVLKLRTDRITDKLKNK